MIHVSKMDVDLLRLHTKCAFQVTCSIDSLKICVHTCKHFIRILSVLHDDFDGHHSQSGIKVTTLNRCECFGIDLSGEQAVQSEFLLDAAFLESP